MDKVCTICGQQKPLTAFNRQKRGRLGRTARCRKCKKISEDLYYECSGRKNKKRYRQANLEIIRKRLKKWQQENQHIKNYYTAMYRAMKKKATPQWLSKQQKEEIRQVYKKAKQLSKSTGIPHQVDHVIPIKGQQCRGLHVPWNLQILTKEENNKKNNKLED